MAANRRYLNCIRDCVKNAYENGVERGQEFRTMRHALIVELKRQGIPAEEVKDLLVEWNRRCERRLSPSEIKRQLFDYVDWVFSQRETRLGCKALQDYCIGEDICQHKLRTTKIKKIETAELPFDIRELEKFLEERFKADGYAMALVAKAIRFYQQKNGTGEIILVGYRTLSSIIRDRWGHNLYPMDVCRRMQLLIDEGVVAKIVQGRGGTFSKEANGYRFLPWKHP